MGLDFSMSTQSHNLNILNSRFSYMSSEIIKIPHNSANLFIQNSKFDHFLSPSLTISSRSYEITNKTFNERTVFPATTTKIKLKNCIWSNFFSNSDKGACFGIQGISEAKITGCSFINIVTYAKYTIDRGAFMISIDDLIDPDEFTFKNNIMVNISSANFLNTTIYQAFYVNNNGKSTFSSNSIALLSQGSTFSCLLKTLSSTAVSYSNFTQCHCKLGSGLNAKFFDKSSIKVRYSIFSKLGGFELLRLGCSKESILGPSPQQQSAKVTVEYVSFYENEGSLLIALNNNMGSPQNSNNKASFSIRFSMASSSFFRNKNMTYPMYVSVPKMNLFALSEFTNCVSDSRLVVQPEIKKVYYSTLEKGWLVIATPTDKPTDFSESIWPSPIETGTPDPTTMIEPTSSATLSQTPNATFTETPTGSISPSPTESISPSPTESISPSPTKSISPSYSPSSSAKMTPTATPKPHQTPAQTSHPPEPTDTPQTEFIIREGDVFTTTPSTSSLLIEGVASINIDSLQDLQFSSYNSETESSQINLFGQGIEQADSSQNDVELTVKEFKNVTINVFDSKRSPNIESVISLPIVVSEVSIFEINNGFNQYNEGSEITIKSIKAPTKTKDFTSHVTSNSKLNIKVISFSTDESPKRLHQVVSSHSKYSSNVDSILVSENVEAELVNFTVKDKINIDQNSDLKLKQTDVSYATIIEFNVNTLNEIGQIQIENSKPLNAINFTSYSFTPNKIKLNILDNSISDGKQSIVKGISEENCNQMFVSFSPQKNLQGDLYRSSCEDNQLYISVETSPTKSSGKSNKINNGIIAAAVFGGVVLIVIVASLIYVRVKKSTKAIIDPSDAFEVSIGTNHTGIYN